MPLPMDETPLERQRRVQAEAKRRSRERGGAELKARERRNLQEWRQRNVEHFLWLSAKGRARRAGIEFAITKADVVVPTHCPYLGVELARTAGRGKQMNNPSIDRIDNTRGYVPGNVEVVSYLANMMKNQATPEQLRAFAQGVLRRFGG